MKTISNIVLLWLILAVTSVRGADPQPHVSQINAWVQQGWSDFEVVPAADATDGEWCRRIFLDVLGRIPALDELKSFLTERSPDKKTSLVRRLLEDSRYADEYASHWADIWTNILIGRTGGTRNNSLTSRTGLRDYLKASFLANKPYDRLMRELVTATGTQAPETSDFNGAVNFLIEKLDDRGIQATTATSRVFLGLHLQCTQCHDHPFNDWKQNRFWELNAFFRQATPLRRYRTGTDDLREVALANQDFGGEGSTPEEAEVYYEQRNGILHAAYPAFVDGTPLANRSGFLADVDRRQELAEFIVGSTYSYQAMVNRMWAHFLGYGFTTPFDDIGPHQTPSHPELVEYLVTEFRQSGSDIRQLITWIVLSRPYALSSRGRGNANQDLPNLGQPPKFSRFYVRQLRPEEVYESLLIATHGHYLSSETEQARRAKDNWLRQFTRDLSNDEGEESTTFDGTIPQTLSMFNGRMIKQATQLGQDNWLSSVATSEEKLARKVSKLYHLALARKPTPSDIKLAGQLATAHIREDTSTLR